MLHFCTVDDIKDVMPAGPRYDNHYELVRNAVTQDFNRYMRRDLGYKSNHVEYFDLITLSYGQVEHVYLDKKVVDGAIDIRVDRRRGFDTDTILDTASYSYDGDGKLTLYGPTSYCARAVRVTYSGGYPEILTGDPPDQTATGVMQCPESLKLAAIDEAVFRLNRTLNDRTGEGEKKKVEPIKTVDGLLVSSSRALHPYRRLLARVL